MRSSLETGMALKKAYRKAGLETLAA